MNLTSLTQLKSESSVQVKFKVVPSDSGFNTSDVYDAKVKLWKKKYGDTGATTLIILNNYQVSFKDVDTFNSKFVLVSSSNGRTRSTSLDKLTIPQLREKAAQRKISLTGITKKADILAKIRGKK